MGSVESKSSALNPTLWRTCRSLANKNRLRVLRELCARPDQQVSDVARRLGISMSLASQSLRALNARGLLSARRSGPLVYYTPSANRSIPNSSHLLQAIQKAFTSDKNPCENMFRSFTAFTHPRRISIVNLLWKNPMRLGDLSAKAKISRRALGRHLRKLISRGIMKRNGDTYYVSSMPRNSFARFIIHLARLKSQTRV